MAAMAAIRVKGDTAGSLATVVSLNDDNQRFRDRHGAVATLTSNHILRLARSLILGRQFSPSALIL